MAGAADTDRERAHLFTPLGEPGSGLVRYAAAMALWRAGLVGSEELEVFRACARMDAEDPALWARTHGVDWTRIAALRPAAAGS